MNPHILKLRTLLLSDKLYYIIFALAIIYFLIFTVFIKYKSEYNISDSNFDCIILNYKIDGNKLNLNLRCREKLVSVYYFKTENELYWFKDSVNFGDRIRITGNLEEPEEASLPNTFDYKKYLYNNKIFFILNIDEYKITSKNKNIFYSVKNTIYERIDDIKNNEYIYAFVLGQTSFIDGQMNDMYGYNGVTHLFALSGTNVALVYLLVSYILKKIKFKELTIHIIISIMLLLIIFITGFSPSIIRASVFFILLGINKIFYFYIKSINILLLTFFIIVICDPFIIYNIGFQLSFVISFFLILFNSIFNSKNKIKNLFLVGLISFLSSIPIIVYNFYYINFLSLFNNMIFVPLVSYIIFPLSLISFVFPFFSNILNLFVRLMELISSFLYNIKFFCLTVPKINLISMLLYYLLFIIFNKFKKKRYLILMIICILYTIILNKLDNNYYLYFLDVGQGDSMLIKTPNNDKIIMVDTGGKLEYFKEEWQVRDNEYSYVKSSLIPFLNSIGISNLDYLYLTHGDADHMGYAYEFTNNFNVNIIYINKGSLNYLEQELKNAIKINKKVYKINNNFIIESLNNKIYSNENENSLVLLLNIYDYKILLMGDASKITEKDIINSINLNNINILKVGHHGSNTSTSEDLLKEINTKYAIISAGKNNKYNHPSREVIKLLEKYNIKILSTIENNTIIFKVNKRKLYLKINENL